MTYPFVLTSLILGLLVAAISSAQASETDPAAPIKLGAVKAAIVELESGKTLYSKHSDWVTPIASITKLMTALVVMQSGQDLDEWIEIPKPDRETRKNAYSRIRIGSQLQRGNVLRLALMSSENLAAYTLAARYPGGVDAFVGQMNKTAASLGMSNTHFVDASGLSSGNVSTAEDLVKLIAAVSHYDKIREYSTTPRYTAHFRKPRYALGYGNTNRLVHRNSWDIELSKTGYITEAGRCLVLLSKLEGRDVAMVFLDAFGKQTPLGDAGRVKRWISTGDSGRIAGAALRYEQSKSKEYPYLKDNL
ncbi:MULTISPECIES: D-alanyl-D-alanine endopeptidase [unclassified Ketobacter]|uniref:D-alanyl-D-alanine endopeptidase n=1 Tax=unclassified Ketobacter TaxID=2639109 RepID=UPI0025BB3424|nr:MULTISPECIES: D-alanyl-D-alanine endopeptidase [unclassified Ketobacter]MEC8812711.1 D-alanyl-D-alanine endopeptidase [Pseudomonadota bacterium]